MVRRQKSMALMRTVTLVVGLWALAGLSACERSREHPAISANGDVQAAIFGMMVIHDSPEMRALEELSEPELNAVVREQVRRLDASADQIEDEVIDAYEAVFTRAELNAIGRFYRSPEGRSIAEKHGDLYARLSHIGEKALRDSVPPAPVR